VANDPVNGRDPSGNQTIDPREDGRRIVYVLPQKRYDTIIDRHGPDSTRSNDKFRTEPSRQDLARYAQNAMNNPSAVNDEGRNGTATDGKAVSTRDFLFTLKGVGDTFRGVGSEGQSMVRVVTVPLSDVGDPTVAGQARAEAAASAPIADAVTGTRAAGPPEVRVIMNVYPIKDEQVGKRRDN
ncbi:hypothetical protein, partial [Sphingomonas bacterium]|uniref:hypothetical protein n=1 Tax=Sphingomonas bacterium TaxID=1895847 RepID=UPI001C2D6520